MGEIEELWAEIRAIRRELERGPELLPENGTSWTPILNQGVDLGTSIGFALYWTFGKLVCVKARVAMTSGAAAAGNLMIVRNLPFVSSAAPTHATGTWQLYDGTHRAGNAEIATSSQNLYGYTDGNTSGYGITPSVALAVGNVITFTAWYERA